MRDQHPTPAADRKLSDRERAIEHDAADPKLRREEHRAVRVAGRLGLFLLIEGRGWKRRGRISSRTSGRPIATFTPAKGTYIGHVTGMGNGRAAGWDDVLKKAAAVAAQPGFGRPGRSPDSVRGGKAKHPGGDDPGCF